MLLDGSIDNLPAVGDQAAGENLVVKTELEALLVDIPVFGDQAEEVVGEVGRDPGTPRIALLVVPTEEVGIIDDNF